MCSRDWNYWHKSEDLILLRAADFVTKSGQHAKNCATRFQCLEAYKGINMLNSTHLERVDTCSDFVTEF